MGSSQSGSVGGRSAIPLPHFIRATLLKAVEVAENKLGRPVSYIEIYAVCSVVYGHYGFNLIGYAYTVALL
jgi:hypothetical protein